ncbi:MAG: valine--tRNA ligase [Clostridia bacterium]|nr:valine--tRNA ligase [Clostridia bacterium]
MKSEMLDKTYSPSSFEEKHYNAWLAGGYFDPKPGDKGTFSVVIPPPNVTGQLHLGHALNHTTQDILVRYKRMQGFETLWLPGTDHAGIATQIRVEQALREEEGLSRHDLGREKFTERVWAWKEKYGATILKQTQKLGSSCDFSRLRFTMDEGLSRAVRKTFVDYYNKGLIYQGYRITNWCPHCVTALADTEVEHKDLEGHFWDINYPLADGSGFVTIATTRPETLLGDTAIAVHPEDERYQAIIGKEVILPLVERKIPVIADEYVDREFGTGVVKITPCHDPNDFEVGLRHDLPQICVFDDHARVNEFGGKYEGMERFEARKAILADLEEAGLLVGERAHSHAVGHCYRCGTVIEPLASKQWFVKMKPLAAPAIEAVKSGEIKFVPEHFEKIYLNWMENIHDWCISRQLWWGHRIPAFYCDDCGKTTVCEEDIDTCPHCGGKVHQDEDVLDTWFSSALWPFSTLGWPDETEDLKRYYPTSVLVTAYDIITFWVSKMIFSGLALTDKAPFPTVFIHGLVRDNKGRKMSKSLGNGIDPLEVVEQYGADALRFTLAGGSTPGNDLRFSLDRVEASRNFANKLWNASRFVLMNLAGDAPADPADTALATEDKWILGEFNRLVDEVSANLDKYEIGIALSKLYDFVWDIFCDWYIELSKPRLNEKGTAANLAAQSTLCYILSGTLKLLHPFMPFITEEIYQKLPTANTSIMISAWPEARAEFAFEDEMRAMERVIEAITAVRRIRAEKNVAPKVKAPVYLKTEFEDDFKASAAFFERLAGAASLSFVKEAPEGCIAAATTAATAFLRLADLVDTEAEKKRLSAECENLEKLILSTEKKLDNADFVARAPEAVVQKERDKLAGYRAALENARVALAAL